ncbi:MAG: hypothetical protein EA385_07660 [Salinarimonadaceae bacterium]|nr:MAG: hypothetical protein EA385_07660 [Salinarimonadaceae bacterium]
MNKPSDRNRPAPQATGRSSAAPGDFAPKQPVAFSSSSLRATGESPAEAARRLGMIDPAFMRVELAPPHAAGAPPVDPLAASRDPAADTAPPLHAPQPQSGQASGHAAEGATPSLDAIPGYAPVDPVARIVPQDHASQEPSLQEHPPESRGSVRATGERDGLAGRLAAGAATAKAFVAAWWAKRAASRAAARAANQGETDRLQKLTPKEKRWRRRRQRLVFEEGLAWVLVPVILVGIYYAMIGGLAMFGMSVDDLVQGLHVAWTQLR